MNNTREIRKAVKMEKLQRRNRHFNSNIASHTDNIQNVINHTEHIISSDDGDTLTERQRYIVDKLIESRNYKGYPIFDEDYNHLCKNLLSNIILIDGIEVVAVQYSFGSRFSFIENNMNNCNP
ncbi:MAG: hypothetical protein LBN27_06660 [Prevotellaceae bacterium]|jgi:hypothetical protein|nr:hypothetical protein [Prevotellaceae bacterium]